MARSKSKSKGRAFKVFQAQFGFYDVVVAATSQVRALEIWGTHQNLFADGQAKRVTDPEIIKVASAHPETPLRRAVGSSDAFALTPSSLPKIPDAPNADVAKDVSARRPKTASEPKPKPAVDREPLEAAEKALRAVDEHRRREEAALAREQDALDRKKAEAQDAYVTARKAASTDLVAARSAYRKAAGEDR